MKIPFLGSCACFDDKDADIRFDSHCHIFNLEYLLLEMCQIGLDILDGRYVLRKQTSEKSALLPDQEHAIHQWTEALEWLLELFGAVIGSETRNARFLQKAARKSWGTKRLRLFTLLMDIYFMYAPPVRNSANETDRAAVIPDHSQKHPSESLSRLGHLLENTLFSKTGLRNIRPFPFLKNINLLLQWIETRIDEHRSNSIPGFDGVFMTAGFYHQIKATLNTAKRLKGQVFPFLAVDPRRSGIIDAVLKGHLVSASGPFYGIKLYPRLGVHPETDSLIPLYQWCEKNHIPITTHCSYKGFPDNLMNFADYGNPDHFRSILAQFSEMKIDFAHFGDRPGDNGEGADWEQTIQNLIKSCKNVYTDLSCFTHKETLERLVKQYPIDHPVWDKTLYGSDFDVMFFTNPGGVTMEEYNQMFLDLLGPECIKRIAGNNPREFLPVL